jgi:hypothetical protein
MAVLEREDPVHVAGQFHVVGRDQGGGALVADHVVQGLEHSLGGGGIEVAGRLVGQQQAGLVGQGAGDGDALLLAARHLGRLVVETFGQAQTGQQFPCPLACVGERRGGDAHRQGHVVQRRELRQQVVELIDEAELGQAHARALALRQVGAVHPVDQDAAAVGMLQQAGGVQQRRLARTGWADQPDQFAGTDVEVHAPQHRQALVAAGDIGAFKTADGQDQGRATHNEAPQPDLGATRATPAAGWRCTPPAATTAPRTPPRSTPRVRECGAGNRRRRRTPLPP